MIDRELEAEIQFVRENGSADDCFRLSRELGRRAQCLFDRIWSRVRFYSNWELRAARRAAAHGCALESKAHGDYLARHKWAKYKRQFLNYKTMVELSDASSEMMQLWMSREEEEDKR